MSLLYEAHRMSTIEPFKISIPKPNIGGITDKVVDVGKDVGGTVTNTGGNIKDKVVDVGKDVGGKVVDVGKDVGGKVVDIGKSVGGKIVDIGKGIGKVLGPAFKKLLEFFMMLLKNWKLALLLVVGLFILFWVSRVVGVFRMFTG
jgi:hypothetical protein